MKAHPVVPALLLALLAAAPAAAQPLARVSGGNPAVHAGPGQHYSVVGRLPNGAQVPLDYCTPDDRWCFVTDTGWVEASWLVGWAAKMRVTPPRLLFDPFAPPRNERRWPGW